MQYRLQYSTEDYCLVDCSVWACYGDQGLNSWFNFLHLIFSVHANNTKVRGLSTNTCPSDTYTRQSKARLFRYHASPKLNAFLVLSS